MTKKRVIRKVLKGSAARGGRKIKDKERQIQKDYIESIGIRDSGNQEIVRWWAELEIENRSCMEIRATKRGMSRENLKIIVRGKDCGGFSALIARNRKLDGGSR